MMRTPAYFQALRRRFAALILALTLILAVPTSALCAASASDDEITEAAEQLHELGLFNGTGLRADGTPEYALDRALSRSEAVTMLVRLLGQEETARKGAWKTPFTDVAPWAAPYVGYAYHHGLTAGIRANAYGAEQPVTAAQYLTFLLRALGYSSDSDFSWDRSWELTDRLGVTRGEYGAGSSFTRGDAALVSYRALRTRPKGQDVPLLETLMRTVPRPDGSSLTVCFLDVGQADAALVLCDGHAMLIDGGNADDSQRIYACLKAQSLTHLDAIVCTHPHEDHTGGLAAALRFAKADRALCPVVSYESRAFASFVKYLAQQGKSLTVPKAGHCFRLGSAFVQVLGPTEPGSDLNNNSLVLRIVYGDTAFLFTGDAGREEEASLLAAGFPLSATVLKVGHHGSNGSTTYPFLRQVMPRFAVISVGQNNSYGHPAEDLLSRLRDAGATVLRTDMQGDILCRSDGKAVSVSVTRNPDADTLGSLGNAGEADSTVPEYYVLNTSSLKFHRPDCASVARMSEKNKQVFHGTREEVLAMGYVPCAACNP